MAQSARRVGAMLSRAGSQPRARFILIHAFMGYIYVAWRAARIHNSCVHAGPFTNDIHQIGLAKCCLLSFLDSARGGGCPRMYVGTSETELRTGRGSEHTVRPDRGSVLLHAVSMLGHALQLKFFFLLRLSLAPPRHNIIQQHVTFMDRRPAQLAAV